MTDERTTIEVVIPTTDSLDLDGLKARAEEALLPYQDAEDGKGIVVTCADQPTADFWTERGEMWGRNRDFDDDQSALDSDDPADA